MIPMIIIGSVVFLSLLFFVIYFNIKNKKNEMNEGDNFDIAKVKKKKKIYYITSAVYAVLSIVILVLVVVFNLKGESQLSLCFIIPLIILIIYSVFCYGKGKKLSFQIQNYNKKDSI